jgi:sugar lactone lactonase YvrE
LKTYIATVALEDEAILGEGPVWHPIHKMLYWVDIQKQLLHALELHTNQHRQWEFERRVSAVIPCVNGSLILALQGGLVSFDPMKGWVESLLDIERESPDIRCNDAKADPFGRIWIGTMHVDCRPGYGSLYFVDSRFRIKKLLGGLAIPNGMAWSLNHEVMYFIESTRQNVMQFDVSAGTIPANGKIAIQFNHEKEVPDGMCIDAEGMLWIAFYAGQRVGRYDPASGTQLAEIKVPSLNVTSCCFGGEDLDTLFITTARQELNTSELTELPQSGSLFSCKVDVKGLKPFYFEPAGK